jgi:hypothetical protein
MTDAVEKGFNYSLFRPTRSLMTPSDGGIGTEVGANTDAYPTQPTQAYAPVAALGFGVPAF